MIGPKWLVWGIVALTIAYVCIRSSLNATGMCLETYKYISADALIEAARHKAYQIQNSEYHNNTLNKGGAILKYEDYNDFVKRNPDCCTLVKAAREGFSPSLYDRISGTGRTVVKVVYASTTPNSGPEPGKKTAYFFITNCGQAWGGV